MENRENIMKNDNSQLLHWIHDSTGQYVHYHLQYRLA